MGSGRRGSNRPPVSFYEIGGFRIDPFDPDPYNVYNSPDWQPLIVLAEEHTDIIRLMSPVRDRSIDPTGSAIGGRWHEFFRDDTQDDGETRVTRTQLTVAGRTLTQVTKRERQVNTVWTVEPLLKNAVDVEAYLTVPDEVFTERIDIAPLQAEEDALGDRGIVMVDTEEPALRCCGVDDHGRLHGAGVHRTSPIPPTAGEDGSSHPSTYCRGQPSVSRQALAHLWPGVRLRTLPAAAVVRRICRALCHPHDSRHRHAHGGYARVHCHGRVKKILDMIAGMGADALDPIEPPPQGDVTLRVEFLSAGRRSTMNRASSCRSRKRRKSSRQTSLRWDSI